jgi:uracil-DNA glycosylase family 4
MDVRAWMQLQTEWGVDECLLDTPQDRRAVAPLAPPVMAPPVMAQPVIAQPVITQMRRAPADLAVAGDLDALAAAINSFTGCALRETASHTVLGEGPVGARVMLVGDAPGAEEDRAGRPFVGPAGQLLDKMLASIGLARAQVRLSHILPWRPPGDRPPSETEIAACLPFLHREVALIAPDYLVLLGANAARALLGEAHKRASISRLRGVWTLVEIPGRAAPCPALPCYHPLYLLRSPAAKASAWADLLSLRARLEQGD